MNYKKHILLWIVVLIATESFAQFGSVNYIDTINQGSVVKIKSGDFNNDGWKDVVVINNQWPHDKVNIYYNNSGINFSSANLIVPLDSFNVLHNMAVADIDNDGWEDILISEEAPNRLMLLKNNAGIFSSQLFATPIDFPSRVIINDFDNNGFLDVLSLQHLQVLIYMQNSSGFDSGTIIHSGTEFYDLNIDDFNNDGFTEIVIASIGFEILINDGNANFTVFSDAGNGITFNLGSGDLDNDGDNDIITWEALMGILFYENDGAGNFAFHDTILKHTDNFISFVVHDFDLDNQLDVYTSFGQQGSVIWMQNNGAGGYSSPSIIHTEPGQLIYEVYAEDVNGDNKKEIFWGMQKLAYHLNNFILAINEQPTNDKIEVYPNPGNNFFYIKNKSTNKVNFDLYDVSGKKVKAGIVLEKDEVAKIQNINFSGVYIIEIRLINGDVIYRDKIIFN